MLHLCTTTDGETAVNKVLEDKLIRLAEGHRDEALRREGKEAELEEDPHQELLFQIPVEGYSGDSVVGVPSGLREFLQPMISAGEYIHVPVQLWLANTRPKFVRVQLTLRKVVITSFKFKISNTLRKVAINFLQIQNLKHHMYMYMYIHVAPLYSAVLLIDIHV